ncbi:enoyl-ACP reductase FabV [Thaumasiovibrio subtropicus]|uniref:enoyl-ACP reductase FabV n=1 Tax=Thaumasiovibrio subtropicus TaxID=1891207 RepID=UPI000B352055|nr:enoyl-ACP reductase FabV [Thaumasiovibrio subtropicus]
MKISPIIKGVVAKNAHPAGCAAAVKQQIDFVKHAPQVAQNRQRVLILGASSGFGLASRIALTFGGAKSDTIGVSFEKGPSEKGTGTAGWYNNIAFKQYAASEGHIAINIVGDAFSQETRNAVNQAIDTYFGGQVDLLIYSLATGIRPKPNSEEWWRSSIKTVETPFSGLTADLEHDRLIETHVTAASEQEIDDTVKVMGGEDWQQWVSLLLAKGQCAHQFQTLAYSYIGPELTYPIYHHGTLGLAKQHLHRTANTINEQLTPLNGSAYIAVCKALVTKASVFIPAFSPYLLALFKVMKAKGLHEGCIEQMHRLFYHKFQPNSLVPLSDDSRLIRLDDWELQEEVQQEVRALYRKITPLNFQEISDYEGVKRDFLALNGFAIDGVDYGV